jgi:biopolymer transport protein TolQ
MIESKLSIIFLISNASVPVQIVIAILGFISITSWAIIFGKTINFRRVKKSTNDFEREFWSGGELLDLLNKIESGKISGSMANIFEGGMREFIKSRKESNLSQAAIMDNTRRALKAASFKELDELEKKLSFLATAGSVSPYIGLFGTVWGIMQAFLSLANIQQATLANVAPGIAEALIATAIGLLAAIPAVIAFNNFSTTVEKVSTRFDTFIEEFSNILQRQPY